MYVVVYCSLAKSDRLICIARRAKRFTGSSGKMSLNVFKDRLLGLRRMAVLLHEVAAAKAIRWSWLPASFRIILYNFLCETTLPVLPFRVSAFRLSQLPMLIISLGTVIYTLISMPWGLAQWATSKSSHSTSFLHRRVEGFHLKHANIWGTETRLSNSITDFSHFFHSFPPSPPLLQLG